LNLDSDSTAFAAPLPGLVAYILYYYVIENSIGIISHFKKSH
jgi:hypothetical protein